MTLFFAVVLYPFFTLSCYRWSVAFVIWPILWLRVQPVQAKHYPWYVHLLRGRKQSMVSWKTNFLNYPEDGCTKLLRNVGTYIPIQTA